MPKLEGKLVEGQRIREVVDLSYRWRFLENGTVTE
jgi:hypothetical protein